MTHFSERPDVRTVSHVQNNALFMRLDSFLERCHDILDLTQTIVQFSKLAKIEVGGTKGNTLTASVKQVRSMKTIRRGRGIPAVEIPKVCLRKTMSVL